LLKYVGFPHKKIISTLIQSANHAGPEKPVLFLANTKLSNSNENKTIKIIEEATSLLKVSERFFKNSNARIV
jgi:hypothetical protein